MVAVVPLDLLAEEDLSSTLFVASTEMRPTKLPLYLRSQKPEPGLPE